MLTALYFLGGLLGKQTAFLSGSVSLVWPPSGIALAAILLFGFRLWPGIFLGAFAANVAVFAANHVASGVTTTAVSLSIACGNTLEAVLGAWLLQRLITIPSNLAKPLNVYKFILV